MEDVVIVSAVRTAIGSYGGSLASLSATQLGSKAIAGAIEKSKIKADAIQEVFMGNVISANLGQAPARQAALGANIPQNVPCTTVNKVCASGMKSIMLAAQSIKLGDIDVAVAGGMESMSNIPYYLPDMRWGKKMGPGKVLDGMLVDGLVDPYDFNHMGLCGELCAKEMGISREEQDAYAIASYEKAAKAWQANKFSSEIIDIEVPQRKGEPVVFNHDEEYKNIKIEKVPHLRPVFDKNGSVTAANASTLNDGASAFVLMSQSKADKLGLTPIAKIIAYADAATEPKWFTIAPALAIPKALEKAKLNKDQIDFYEINEAFAVVALANNKKLDIPAEKVNIYGGGVSLGHPLGCSGARITATLISALTYEGGKYGAASLCNGGGGASAIVIEKL